MKRKKKEDMHTCTDGALGSKLAGEKNMQILMY